MTNNSSSDNNKENNNKPTPTRTPINKMTPGSQGRKWRQDTADFSEESNSENKK